MAEFHSIQHLIGDLLDHQFRDTRENEIEWLETSLALPIPVGFEFVQDGAIAVLEDQMEFVLSFGFEHFDQIHQVLVFQMLKDRAEIREDEPKG